MKPSLWLVNASGEEIGSNRQSLHVDTWAEKCNFNNSSVIYCAVPKKLEEGAGLFPELAKNTIDKLYRIDVNTGAKKIIAIPENDYNISNIIISDDGKYLYFTDEKTSRIHKINLK
jgi:sugar lactone lactonase YvrE